MDQAYLRLEFQCHCLDVSSPRMDPEQLFLLMSVKHGQEKWISSSVSLDLPSILRMFGDSHIFVIATVEVNDKFLCFKNFLLIFVCNEFKCHHYHVNNDQKVLFTLSSSSVAVDKSIINALNYCQFSPLKL